MSNVQYNGQAQQDKFVLTMLKHKQNGTFLELGGNDPCHISNSYFLETRYNWKGIIVEYDESFRQAYLDKRPKSTHVFHDATTFDYASLLNQLQYPAGIDYLQIDLEAENGSTLAALQNLDANVFPNHKFATVTFEHDVYSSRGDDIFKTTRAISRQIFENRGYVRVFSDVGDSVYNEQWPFEDWYVHPDLVDMNYVNSVISNNAQNYVGCNISGTSINFNKIQY
jgi:hypothetical protein